MLLPVDFYVGDIAGCAVGYKYNHIIHARDGIAFCCHICYLYSFKQGEFFLFTCQCL
jgi:hypothetical protein